MITLQIVDGSLQVSNNGSIILVAPKNSCAIDVLSLYDAIPLAVIYNKYLGTSTNIFTQPLANCENSVGTPFTVNSFIAFAEANLGFDTVGGGCGGSSPFEYNANATGIQPILGTNDASGCFATIGGGRCNTASGCKSIIGGGYCNKIFPSLNDDSCAKISDVINGGQSNVINTNTYCTVSYAGGNTIGGGLTNVITPYSGGNTIGGGRGNIVNCDFGVIGGGFCNLTNGNWSSIVGGFQNSITCCDFSFIGGGKSNVNNGNYSGILGGKSNNTNNCSCSMIVGNNITANRSNTTFVNDLSVCSMSACSGCSVKVSTNGLLITNNLSGAVHTFLKPAVGQSTNVSLNGTAISTIVGIVNKLTVSPFIPAQTITSASLYINVTVSGIGSNARILIYSNLNGKPDIKLYESANLDCSTTGIKTATTVQTFEAGTTYWIGVQTSSTQTLSGIIIASLTPIFSITNVMSTSLFITPAFGSAPTPFGSGTAQNLTVPLVGITL